MKNFIAVSLLAGTAFAQNQPNVVSPQVLPDRHVTFRVLAPKASDVTLTVDWLNGTEKLTKGDDGVWSVTVGPLAPATYIYSYSVDGVVMADPVNPRIKLRARGSGSLFDVPAETPAMWQARDVPHGSVEINWQNSKVLKGETRWIWVYTPPGYDKERDRRYPVLYLLHGSNDTAAGWTTAGSANFILDNLIAEKKAVPMIVVMPFGHALPFGNGRGGGGAQGGGAQGGGAQGGGAQGGGAQGGAAGGAPAVSNTILFEQYLLNDVMPTVESKYRIAANRDSRAIAGMSMGGEQALAIGFGHAELFSSIGALSPSTPRELAERWAAALSDPKGTNSKMKTLWIACGRQDPGHLTASRRLDETLTKSEIKHVYVETEGAHNYALWQQHMVDFVPRLFH